jgi:hypothetical protein
LLDRLWQRQRAFAPQTRPGWAHGPGQDGTIVPRQAVVPSGEEENKGIRAAAGGPLPALNLAKAQARIRGEVSKDAPDERRAADRTIRFVPGILLAPAALFLLKDGRAAWPAWW